MRRWSGRVRDIDIELTLTLQCFDDSNHRLSRTLSMATDTVCESLVSSLAPTINSAPTSFFWMTDPDGVNTANARITGNNTPAAHFFLQHRLRIESLFTYESQHPVRGLAPVR